MPPITLDQRQKINHQLKLLGFGGLEDPNIFAQIATLSKTHDAFRGLLMSTAPDQRKIAYEAIRPHLCFRAKPLDVYEAETRDRAEREQWDVYDGSAYPKPFKPQEIEADTRKHAWQMADRAGWREVEKKAYCPKHVPKRCTMTLTCAAEYPDVANPGEMKLCGMTQRIRCFNEQDGYADARLRGWSIGDVAKCPECTARQATKTLLQ
jgi:hypothetical protein